MSIVQTKDALEDTQTELADTEKFLQQLATECATKEKEWAERQKIRGDEVKAISEAISILNDDDALAAYPHKPRLNPRPLPSSSFAPRPATPPLPLHTDPTQPPRPLPPSSLSP